MNWYRFSAKTQEVALKGILRDNDGYIYLEVDNRLISPMINMISIDSVISPKEVTDKDKDVGAHISVMKKKETEGKEIKEIGNEYTFFINGLESVDPDEWEEVKKVYFLKVTSPELEELRESYDLPSKINDHDFHITVGVEKG